MDDRVITSILISMLGKDYNPQNIKYKRKEAENDDKKPSSLNGQEMRYELPSSSN